MLGPTGWTLNDCPHPQVDTAGVLDGEPATSDRIDKVHLDAAR
jgi:hypothetical protein